MSEIASAAVEKLKNVDDGKLLEKFQSMVKGAEHFGSAVNSYNATVAWAEESEIGDDDWIPELTYRLRKKSSREEKLQEIAEILTNWFVIPKRENTPEKCRECAEVVLKIAGD